MILTLALRNLLHDRVRLAVTLIGILFLDRAGRRAARALSRLEPHDHRQHRAPNADLLVTTFGAKSFEDGGVLLTDRERHQALATPGVQSVVPLVVAFAEWRKPAGGSSRVVVVGSDTDDKGLVPWSLSEGTLEDIKAPDAIAVDRSYLGELGINGIGDTAQVAIGRVKVPRADRRRALVHAVAIRLHDAQSRPPIARRAERRQIDVPARQTRARRRRSTRCKADLLSRLNSADVLTKEEFATAA